MPRISPPAIFLLLAGAFSALAGDVPASWTHVLIDDSRARWGDFAEPEWLRYFGLDARDLDGDGDLDLVSGRYVYRNPGRDMAGPWERLDLGANVDGMLLTDVDGDDPIREIDRGKECHLGARLFDLDGDGDLDIVGPAWDDWRPLHLWRHDSGALSRSRPSFRRITVDAAGPADPWTKIAADIDGDGRGDLVVAGRDGPLVWYRSPDWTKHAIADGGWSTVGGAAADVDGDGDLDVIMGGTLWYENPGEAPGPLAARWAAHRVADDPTHDVVTGDFDGDGRLDIATRNQSEFEKKAGHRVRVWLQQAQGEWEGTDLSCPHGEGLVAADLDADGDPDLVAGAVWLETRREPGGVRWASHAIAAWHPNAQVAVADFNGDGRPDVALSPSELAGQMHRLSWFEAPSDPRVGGWREHVLVSTQECVVHSLVAVDLDGDARPDLAYAEMHQGQDPDEVGILLNRVGDWEKAVLGSTGSHGLQAIDFDGDGDADLFGANWTGPHQAVELWENQ